VYLRDVAGNLICCSWIGGGVQDGEANGVGFGIWPFGKKRSARASSWLKGGDGWIDEEEEEP